jgi:hypothetical protein
MMNADGFAGFSRRQQRMGTRGISPVPGACYLLKSRRICNGFGVADHSKFAHYAGGMSVEEIAAQHREIEHLNKSFGKNFRFSGGIESDILADGSLDYPNDVLAFRLCRRQHPQPLQTRLLDADRADHPRRRKPIHHDPQAYDGPPAPAPSGTGPGLATTHRVRAHRDRIHHSKKTERHSALSVHKARGYEPRRPYGLSFAPLDLKTLRSNHPVVAHPIEKPAYDFVRRLLRAPLILDGLASTVIRPAVHRVLLRLEWMTLTRPRPYTNSKSTPAFSQGLVKILPVCSGTRLPAR